MSLSSSEMPAPNERVEIDAALYPAFRHEDELLEYMREPWRSKRFPGHFRVLYPAPTGAPPYGEYQRDSRPRLEDGTPGLPGSDPGLALAHMDRLGTARAVLLPLTRGLLADLDLMTEICAATNRWLAATWLGPWNRDNRFAGTIRVNPQDPHAAVEEIERWGADPRMVQVGVPLQVHQPYGHRMYRDIWRAAAERGLPVAVRSDGGGALEFAPTPAGYPRTFIEYSSCYPLIFWYHVASLIAEGAFERDPGLRFLFVDGGQDVVRPLIWKMDSIWPANRVENPWVSKPPSDYLRSHVRFCTSRLEGPAAHAKERSEWLRLGGAADLLLFASHYPHWTWMTPEDASAGLSPEGRRMVLSQNALNLHTRFGADAPRRSRGVSRPEPIRRRPERPPAEYP